MLCDSGPSLDDGEGDMDTGADDTPPDDGRPGPSRHDDDVRRRRKRTKEQVDC